MDRAKALELLRDQHAFPGPFEFRAFVRPGSRAVVVSAVAAACGEDSAIEHVDERASRQGRWVRLRLRVRAASAEVVLAVYEVLGALDEVVLTL